MINVKQTLKIKKNLFLVFKTFTNDLIIYIMADYVQVLRS